MTQEERDEQRRAYRRAYHKKTNSEERKAIMRERSRIQYYRTKERIAVEKAEREERERLLPKAPDILKDDLCGICKHFSGKRGFKQGWCLKRKKSTSFGEICGQFSPMTDEKFTKVIYKTPGVKHIKGND